MRFLEIISPAGFENYFFELAEPLNTGDEARLGEIVGRYQLDLRMGTIRALAERNGLQPPF